jgi:hypothetical protein
MGDVADLSGVHASAIEVACTSGKSASDTATRCNDPRIELTSIINHLEIPKSVNIVINFKLVY